MNRDRKTDVFRTVFHMENSVVADLRALFGMKNESKQVQQHLCCQN